MSNEIQINGKRFRMFIPEKTINEAIDKLAHQVQEDMQGKEPLFIAVLNGAFMFASELMKRINIPAQISFVRVKSYEGIQSSKNYDEILGLTEDIEGRDIVIIEDVIDSGFTIQNMVRILSEKKPGRIKIATLLYKPEALQCQVNPDYVALSIPNNFIIGYGLDYNGYGRNLKDIYSIIQ